MSHSVDSVLLRASAGTGKTFQLSNHYLRLVALGVDPRSILATTFTRKAAGEIAERVFQRAAEAVLDKRKHSELKSFLGLDDLDAEALFQKLLDAGAGLQVSTLDSFCISLAKIFSDELALPPSWTIGEEVENEQIFLEAVAHLLMRLEEHQLITLIQMLSKSEATRRVHDRLFRELPPLLKLFFESDESAWSWLGAALRKESAKSFDEASFYELAIPKTKKGEPVKLWLGAREGISNFLADGRWKEILSSTLLKKVREGESHYARVEIPDDWREVLASLLHYAEDKSLRELGSELSATHRLLQVFALSIEGLKSQRGLYRFDDVKRLLLSGLDELSQSDLYFRLDSRIEHVLLDEFQDTSLEEWRVIEPLLHEIDARHAEGRSIFCVGDLKQSIYGWRGGKAEIFEHIEQRFPRLSESSQSLNVSYRSSAEVLGFVNRVFSSLEDDSRDDVAVSSAFERFSLAFEEHSSAEPLANLSGIVRSRVFDDESEREEAFLEELTRVTSSGGASVALLCRSNTGLEYYSELLREAGFEGKFSLEGRSSLLRSQFVKSLLQLLRVLEHPLDEESKLALRFSALGRAFLFPDFENRLATLRKQRFRKGLFAFLREETALATLDEDGRYEEFLDGIQIAEERGLSEIDQIVTFLARRGEASEFGAQIRLMTVHQSKGLEFDAVFLPDLSASLLPTSSRAGQMLEYRETPFDPPERISKWPGKSLIAAEPQLEEMRVQHDSAYLFEELCLFYVALTRAKLGLFCFGHTLKSNNLRTWNELLQKQLGEDDFQLGSGATLYGLPAKAAENPRTFLPEKLLLERPKQRRKFFARKAATSAIPERSDAAELGGLLHSVLENVQWFSEGDSLVELLGARVGHSQGARAKEVLTKLESSSSFAELMSQGRYESWNTSNLELFTELPIMSFVSGELHSCRLDRFVFDGERAEIIDFKLSLSSESLGQAKLQLEKYRSLCSESFGIAASKIALTVFDLSACLRHDLSTS